MTNLCLVRGRGVTEMTIVAEDVAVIQVMQEPTVAGERGVVSSIDHPDEHQGA